MIPVEGIVAYLLLGIDQIAIQLEEPFGEGRVYCSELGLGSDGSYQQKL